MVLALRQAEAGTPVGEVCRELEITEATFYLWKRKFAGLGVTELRVPFLRKPWTLCELARRVREVLDS